MVKPPNHQRRAWHSRIVARPSTRMLVVWDRSGQSLNPRSKHLERLTWLGHNAGCRILAQASSFAGNKRSMDSPRQPTTNEPLDAESKPPNSTTPPPDQMPTIVPRSADECAGPAPVHSPDQIGRYKIERVLGSGGFATVYLGYDRDLQRRVAIKVPIPQRVIDAEAYLTEARILASLDHHGIVPVFDVGRTQEGECYVVSKFIEGTDLRRWIQQNRISPQESAEIVASVAEALQYAHTKGLVHRDIKPANILIDGAGKPIVADFGIALRDED